MSNPTPYSIGYAGPATVPYRSSEGLGKILRIFLLIAGILELVGIGFTIYQLTLPPGYFDDPDAEFSIVLILGMLGFGLIAFGVFVTIVVLFCMWMYRAHKNLPALGVSGMKYTPGWAAGAWFVPFLNLVRPFQIMREIWKASDPAHRGGSWDIAPNPGLVAGWWAAWLISNFISNASTRMGLKGGPDVEHASYYVDLFNVPISLLAVWLAWRVIAQVDRMQAESYASMSAYPTATGYPATATAAAAPPMDYR